MDDPCVGEGSVAGVEPADGQDPIPTRIPDVEATIATTMKAAIEASAVFATLATAEALAICVTATLYLAAVMLAAVATTAGFGKRQRCRKR